MHKALTAFAVITASQLHSAVDYVREIKPLLATACVQCHGEKQAKGGLNLDTAANALKGGDSGSVIAAGKANASLLVKLLKGPHGDTLHLGSGSNPRAGQHVLSMSMSKAICVES